MFLLLIGLVVVSYTTYKLYQYCFPALWINPNNKHVLVSGCDTGFGNCLALELDKQNYNVFAGVYKDESVKTLTAKLSSKATVFKLDITKQQDIDAAVELVRQKTQYLYGLVNNAGIIKGGLIDWLPLSQYREVMEVNFFGHVAMTKAFLPLLLKQSDSRVVNLCSVAGFLLGPALSAYGASKFALEAFSDCLRREMSVWGLKVSVIEPGIMRTPLIDGQKEAQEQLWAELPDDVKERWGDSFLEHFISTQIDSVFSKHAENPMKVVQSIQHALSSTRPCTRYRPGWQSRFFFLVSILPAWICDILLKLKYRQGAESGSIRRQ
ncbi:unnamed protein product [Didymodactylos carnosus]|uniref:Uncharacterized protein n=1 Tax=Didymodactylos carnosus TaxID=1234261 RepID=A0A815CNF4_9BILA|nr:unnamed protein product [Didymodactylos carnosus]CAF4087230.1 unnamed protein product [Didymodactylos carnosus]